MTKQIELTDDIRAAFTAKFGEDVDINNFYIFECKALSTEPVHQNTIYDGAVMSSSLIASMADVVNNTDENIGVHIMHESDDLNIGRVFKARLGVLDNGHTAMYADCALLKNEDNKSIIERIENNVLDEVSVAVVPEHAYCSECGWDYMGPEADFENWFNRTCPNDHTIGVDGCHLNLEGLKAFSEISVVNRGAAKNAKILSQKKRSLFSEGELNKFAASGTSPEFFVATFNSKMENTMDEKSNVTLSAEEVSAMQSELADLKQKLDLSEKVKSLESSVAEKDEQIASLTSEKDEKIASLTSELEDAKAKLSEAEANAKSALEFLQGEVKKVALAAGKKDVEVPSDLGGISAMLAENQQILATLVPAGGVSKSANLGEKSYSSPKMRAFQVKR